MQNRQHARQQTKTAARTGRRSIVIDHNVNDRRQSSATARLRALHTCQMRNGIAIVERLRRGLHAGDGAQRFHQEIQMTPGDVVLYLQAGCLLISLRQSAWIKPRYVVA